MSDFGGYSVARLKEELANEELPALKEAGLLSDPATIDHLESFSRHYEPNSAPRFDDPDTSAYYYYNTEFYVTTVRREVSKTLSAAVRNGNINIIQHAMGILESKEKKLDFVDYERLRQLIKQPSLLLLMFGDTGSGKTYTSVRLAELWEFLVGGTILTNVKSLEEDNDGVVYVATYPELLAYCIDNPEERKLFLADELSSLMSGYASDRQDVETYMRPLVRKMRKKPFRMSMIGIGHRVGDIHPTMRNGELAYFAFKEGDSQEAQRKQMAVYQDADRGEEMLSVQGIGLPEMSLDTNDSGNWDWGTESDILEQAYRLESAGYGDMLNLIRNLENDEEDGNEGGDKEDYGRCQAETRGGDQCRNKAVGEHGYCENHKHLR